MKSRRKAELAGRFRPADSSSRRGLAAATVAVLACLILSACGSDATGSDDEPATGGPEPAWLTEAKEKFDKLTELPDTIASASLGEFTPKASADLFYVGCPVGEGCTNFRNSAKAAADAIGYSFEVCEGRTPDEVSGCFQSAINAKPDVILTNGSSYLANGADFDKVEASGIPFITAFSGDDPPSSGVVTDVAGGKHPYQAGVDMALGVIAKSEGKAKAVFFTSEEYAAEIATTEGFKSEMDKCETCEVEYVNYSVASMDTALAPQALTVIQQNPDVDWYAGPNDGVASAVADAVRQSGRTDVNIAGIYGWSPNMQLVRSGEQALDVTHGRSEWGWTAIDAAARVLAGEEVPNVSPVTVVAYTEDNADNVGEFFDGPKDYQDQFLKLWGK